MTSRHGDPSRALDAVQFEAEVVQRKKAGLSFKEIGDELDRAPSYIHRVFWRAIARIPEPAVQEYRTQQLARIELEREVLLDILSAHHVVVQQGHIVSQIVGHHPLKTDDGEDHPLAGQPVFGPPLEDPSPLMAAIAQLRQLDDQEAKLLNLYPATKVDASVQIKYEVVGVDPADIA
jgi:hypothetical protein